MRRIVSVWLPRWPVERLHQSRSLKSALPATSAPSRSVHGRAGAAPDRTEGASDTAVRSPTRPTALALSLKGGQRLVALDEQAERAGLEPGQLVTDTRAILPELTIQEADPAGDRTALAVLADWCTRYTPWTAPWPDTPFTSGTSEDEQAGPSLLGPALTRDQSGLYLDITGCAHLFGGEAALLEDLAARLSRFGLTARLAAADTPGAAWALSRYGADPVVRVASEQTGEVLNEALDEALAPLPIAALRLSKAQAERLSGLGLKTIGAVAHLPRAPLASRFGSFLLRRLDQAWGREEEPICPRPPVVPYRARLVLAEPITDHVHVEHGLKSLTRDLVEALVRDGCGARRLSLALYRVDGVVVRLEVGTARAMAEAAPLVRLFTGKIARLEGGLDAGFGFEVLVLSADAIDRLQPDQYAFPDLDAPKPGTDHLAGQEARGDSLESGALDDDAPYEDDLDEGAPLADRFDPTLGDLMDRLGNRLGLRLVRTLHPMDSHIPERAVLAVPVSESLPAHTAPAFDRMPEGEDPDRPIALLPCAEPIDVVAEIPEGPPRLFRWRKTQYQVTRVEGPERIAPEWWRGEAEHTRDYYRVEDGEGRRFWLYRHGLYDRENSEPSWYLHGFFA